MRRVKRIFFILLFIFAVMQIFQPDRNISSENNPAELANHYHVPDTVETLLNNICYDCHSNNTDYPWFINVQPVGWYMQNRIDEGKKHLNFSTFGNLTKAEAVKKLEAISDVMINNKMPLWSYKLYNKDAVITSSQRQSFSRWALSLKDAIQKDSLGALSKDTLGRKLLLQNTHQ